MRQTSPKQDTTQESVEHALRELVRLLARAAARDAIAASPAHAHAASAVPKARNDKHD